LFLPLLCSPALFDLLFIFFLACGAGAKDEVPTGECDAGTETPALSDTCIAAGVTADSLAQIERTKYEALCPELLNFEFFKDQNEACSY
jgi:hypothetical protein